MICISLAKCVSMCVENGLLATHFTQCFRDQSQKLCDVHGCVCVRTDVLLFSFWLHFSTLVVYNKTKKMHAI